MKNYSMIIEKNNLHKINNAIKGSKINHINVYGETPLMFAVADGYTDKVKTLLNRGADISARSCLLDSALMYATQVEDKSLNKEIIKVLLENGARLNSHNKEGDTVLIHAIKKNNINMVKNLIDLGVDIELSGFELRTPLMVAAKKGHIKILKLLINSGADINRKDMNSNTALIYAISYNQTEAVEILLDKGSKVESHSIFTILKLIDEKYLTDKGIVRYLDCLILNGADINYHGYYAEENEKYTPLMIALRGNMSYQLIKALVKDGALVNPKITSRIEIVDSGGFLKVYATDHPLRLAIYHIDDEDVINMLVREGAKVNISQNCLNGQGELNLSSGYRYEEYMTPLKLAIELNRDQIVDYLIEQGAKYNVVDRDIWDY